MAETTVEPADAEPQRTIYADDWDEARRALALLEGLQGGAHLARLLDSLEAAWTHLRPLQLAAERRPRAEEGSAADDLCRFIDVDVVDSFRGVAFTCARLVPGRRWDDGRLDEVEPEMSYCLRNLRVLALAAAGAGVPAELRDAAASASEALASWHPDFIRCFRPVARTLRAATAVP